MKHHLNPKKYDHNHVINYESQSNQANTPLYDVEAHSFSMTRAYSTHLHHSSSIQIKTDIILQKSELQENTIQRIRSSRSFTHSMSLPRVLGEIRRQPSQITLNAIRNNKIYENRSIDLFERKMSSVSNEYEGDDLFDMIVPS